MTEQESNAILAEYLRRLDAGESVNVEAICEEHPEIADDLRSYVDGDQLLEKMLKEEAADTSQVSMNQETIRPGLAHSTDTEMVGREFGRYKIIRQLGQGAMGAVYLANDSHLKRDVALKIPKFDIGEQQEFMTRFQREAQAAANLNHPGICPVFDIGEENGSPYITMGFINGQPLSRFVGTTQVTDEWIRDVISQIADALAHAHDSGVVHRDLKAGNVLMDTEGRAIVTDFGLARRVDESDESRITKDGAILGTPGYMSPEQAASDPDKLGPPTDIYALGVMLYELLTGELPFRGSLGKIFMLIAEGKRKDPRDINANANAELSNLACRMMSKEIEDRPASMHEVVSILQGLDDDSGSKPDHEEKKTKAKLKKLEDAKQKVGALIGRAQYAQATVLLEKIATVTDADAVGYANWAREELRRVKSLPKKIKDGLPALIATAKKLIKKHDYAQANDILQQVPRELRTEELNDLLEKSIDRQDEVDLLIVDLQECVRTKQYDGIEDNVKRLLKLKPNNRLAKKLWEALNSYSSTPVSRRQYRFDEKGKLLPQQKGVSTTLIWLIAFGVLVFAGMSYAMTLYLKNGNEILIVKIDDEMLKNGDITLTFDGQQHIINGPEFTLTVKPGTYGYEITQGNTTIRNPEQFTIVEDGRNVLEIGRVSDSDPSINTDNRTPLPDGPPGLVKTLKGHDAEVNGEEEFINVLFPTPDGGLISSSSDGKELVWDLAKGEADHDLNLPQYQYAFMLANNDRDLISGGVQGLLQQHSYATGNQSGIYRGYPDDGLEASRSIDSVESGHEVGTFVTLNRRGDFAVWEIGKPDPILEFAVGSHFRWVHVIPEGYLISGYHPDKKALVTDRKGKRLREIDIKNHGKLTVSPDKKTVVVQKKSVIQEVDIAQGAVGQSYTCNSQEVVWTTFTPNGKFLICQCKNNRMYVFDRATGQSIYSTSLPIMPMHRAVSLDNRFIFLAREMPWTKKKDNKEIYVWRLPKECWSTTANNVSGSPQATPIPDGPPGLVKSFAKGDEGVDGVAVSPDGRYLAAGGNSREIYLWEIQTGKLLWKKTTDAKHPAQIRQVLFFEDGQELVVTGSSGVVMKFDAQTGKVLLKYEGHPRKPGSKSNSPLALRTLLDRSGFVTLARDGTIGVWDHDRAKPRKFFDLTDVSWRVRGEVAKDGLLVSGLGSKIKLLDLETGKTLREFSDKPSFLGQYHPKTNKFLRHQDKVVELVDVDSGKVIQSYKSEWDVFNAIFTPDRRHTIVSTTEPAMHVWETDTGKEIAVYKQKRSSEALTCTPDGRFLVFGDNYHYHKGDDYHENKNTEVHIWRLPKACWTEAPSVNIGKTSTSGSFPFPTDAKFTNPRPVSELNQENRTNAYPWISQDGLTIYWTLEGDGGDSGIYQAQRANPNVAFASIKKVANGRLASVSPNGMEIVALYDLNGDGQLKELGTARRQSVSDSFPKPQPLSEFSSIALPKGSAFSEDGNTLLVYGRSVGGELPADVYRAVRSSPDQEWQQPQLVQVQGLTEEMDVVTWPSLTPNGKELVFSYFTKGNAPYEWGAVADATNDPHIFNNPRPLLLDGKRFVTRGGRYCAATGELFYTHPVGSPPFRQIDLYVAKLAKQSSPDTLNYTNILQGHWRVTSEMTKGGSTDVSGRNKQMWVTGSNFRIRFNSIGTPDPSDFAEEVGRMSLDIAKEPVAIDLFYSNKQGKQLVYRGIIRIENGKLRHRYVKASPSSQTPKRPRSFDSPIQEGWENVYVRAND